MAGLLVASGGDEAVAARLERVGMCGAMVVKVKGTGEVHP